MLSLFCMYMFMCVRKRQRSVLSVFLNCSRPSYSLLLFITFESGPRYVALASLELTTSSKLAWSSQRWPASASHITSLETGSLTDPDPQPRVAPSSALGPKLRSFLLHNKHFTSRATSRSLGLALPSVLLGLVLWVPWDIHCALAPGLELTSSVPNSLTVRGL